MMPFLLSILGIGLVAATLPVTAELAVLTAAFLLPRRRHSMPAPGAPARLRLAVVIPAHDEELLIAQSVKSLQASAAASGTRITVVAHNSSDRTAERAAEAGAEVLVLKDESAQGKGFALRHGFEHVFARGADAALVVDADSIVSLNLIDRVRQAFLGGADAIQCRYEMQGIGGRARLAALALRGFNLVRAGGRNRLGLSAGIEGNGFAISRRTFTEVPYRALSLVEDLEYHIHLVMAGKRVEFLEDARVLSDSPASPAAGVTQRSRWEGGRFFTARQWLWPLAGQVAGGRLRLAEPLLDLAGLPLAYATSLLMIALALPVGWLRIYASVSLLVIAAHVGTAAGAGENFWDEIRLLSTTPAYVLWKLRLLPRVLLKSSAGAAWIRTERTPDPEALGPAGTR